MADEAPKAVIEPSPAYAEVADAARAAFQQPRAAEARFEPVVIAPARALDDEAAMRAFVGPNWRAYRRLWERGRAKVRLRYGFGLGPALFGAVWLVYRKQYAWGLGLLAAEAAMAFCAPPLAPIASLILRFFIGRYGKSLALIAGAEEIARQRQGGAATDERLLRAGGVAPGIAMLLLLAEIWLAVHRARLPQAQELDAAGLLANVQHVLP